MNFLSILSLFKLTKLNPNEKVFILFKSYYVSMKCLPSSLFGPVVSLLWNSHWLGRWSKIYLSSDIYPGQVN